MEEQLNPLTARPLPGLALRLLVHQLTPDSHEALLELQQFPGQRQTPPDHPAAGAASPWSAPPAAGALGAENEALAEASSSPTVAELPPLSAEGLLGLLEQHSPAVVAQQLLQHEQQGDEMAMLLVRALGESHDDTLVAGIQNLQWLPGWGQVFHWLLDHAEARQALTVAVRQGLMAPAVPAGEAPRSDDPTTPTTPASPTPVLPGQRLRVDGPFLRQVRHAMNCTQPTFAMIFGVRPRTVQYWEVGRHRMGLRCEVRLQQILTDPVGAPHFRQLGL
ncbi:MAG: hypothetical protein QF615_11795, partial [Planctomycetota bacterium]|nr:hypothetical protein [Planctomycetota bacterium]